jgi:asparagine synthetase B (glutamine-hydrolysing)
MCGIAGGLAPQPDARADPWVFRRMAAALLHRGPDGGAQRTLLQARDRLGERPLHCANRPDGFAFASKLAALLADSGTYESEMRG